MADFDLEKFAEFAKESNPEEDQQNQENVIHLIIKDFLFIYIYNIRREAYKWKRNLTMMTLKLKEKLLIFILLGCKSSQAEKNS